MKKYLLMLACLFSFASCTYAQEIKWTVKQEPVKPVTPESQILTPRNSTFNRNLDSIKMPLRPTNNLGVAETALRRTLQSDPFVLKVDGIKYYMLQNGKIVGYDSTLETLYEPLFKLDKNKDKKLTGLELKTANIRFVKLNENGRLELNNKNLDYSIINVSYIDLKTLRRTNNTGKVGSFGYFDIYINYQGEIKKFIGQITYEDENSIRKLMGK